MGFRGSRVQIPPSRLGEEQASLRLPRWGFFFDCDPLRRVQRHLSDRLGITVCEM